MILYETLSEPLIFLLMLAFGFVCGILYDINKYIAFLCNNNQIVQKVLDVISTCVAGFLFILALTILNYGEFRFYLLLSFLIGIFAERKTLGLVLAKFFSFCYNSFKNLIKRIFKTKDEINRKRKEKFN